MEKESSLVASVSILANNDSQNPFVVCDLLSSHQNAPQEVRDF